MIVCLVTLVIMVIVVVVRYSLFHWEGERDEKIYRSAALQNRCLYIDLNHREVGTRGVQSGLKPQAE